MAIGWAMSLYDAVAGKQYEAKTLPASLFARDDLGIEGHPFDLFEAEEHEFAWKVGDHPLQDGSTVSDHVQRQLREVRVTGMFTNHPMAEKRENREKVKVGEDSDVAMVNRAKESFTSLVSLADKREPVKLVTSLAEYPKMVITSIRTTRDKDSGEAVEFEMTLREIRTVTLKNAVSVSTWQPDDMDTANHRLVAAETNVQQVSAETYELAELYDAEALE